MKELTIIIDYYQNEKKINYNIFNFYQNENENENEKT
jgi:hypothetical protein